MSDSVKSCSVTCGLRLNRLDSLASLKLVFVLLSECHDEWSLARAFPLASTVGHASAFEVNAALVASQWQHRA